MAHSVGSSRTSHTLPVVFCSALIGLLVSFGSISFIAGLLVPYLDAIVISLATIPLVLALRDFRAGLVHREEARQAAEGHDG